MTDFNELADELSGLVIFRSLLKDPVVEPLAELIRAAADGRPAVALYAEFAAALYAHGGNLTEYIINAVLENENVYLVRRAQQKEIPSVMSDCLSHELSVLEKASQLTPKMLRREMSYDGFLPEWITGPCGLAQIYEERAAQIGVHGYGMFAKYDTFMLRGSALAPVKSPDRTELSELFGYEAGAFTGASHKGKEGRIALADKGTLFLDEIGELPMPMQTRLLRFLQDWEIMRVGSTTPKQIDVRIVAATNKNLERAIARGEFRSDLYYRLKVAVIAIPPLRDRQADILPLARMFLRFYGSKYHRQLAFSEEAESLLLDYKWPGNIRELENLVQGLAVTSKDSVIRASDVPISGVAKPAASARRDGLDFELDGKTYKDIMKDLENKVLSAAMERYGSITEVARHFQVDRSTIFRKVKELEKEGKMR